MQTTQKQIQTRYFYSLFVLIHAKNAVLQNFKLAHSVIKVNFAFLGVPALSGNEIIYYIEGFDQERTRTTSHVQHTRWVGGVVSMLVEIFAYRLLNDVFGNKCGRVINPLAFALCAFFFYMCLIQTLCNNMT